MAGKFKKAKKAALEKKVRLDRPELVTYYVGQNLFPWMEPIVVIHEK